MMKLNINGEELLALHNLLRDTLDVYDCEKESMNSDKARLRPVYNRVRAHFMAALSTRADDVLDAVMSREQSKIDKLKTSLDDVKKEHNDLADVMKYNKEYVVPGRDDDLELPDYPKRARRSGNGRKR